jgi:hypothetical protein
MNLKNISWKISVLFSIFLFISLVGSARALVKIEPESIDLSMYSDLDYTVNITISGVNNVYGFQIDLEYDPAIFNVTNITKVRECTFLNRSGLDRTYCLGLNISGPGLVDNFACSRVGTGSVSGSGVLANVTLRLKGLTSFPVTTYINLSNVKISDINSNPLDNTTEDGNVTIYACFNGETKGCVTNDQPGTMTCNLNNEWGSCVASTNGDNGNGGNGGNGGPPAPPQEGEAEAEGEGEDQVLKGDVIEDGCVDIHDLSLIASYFGMKSGFDSRADINKDGEVDIFDLSRAGLDFDKGDNC